MPASTKPTGVHDYALCSIIYDVCQVICFKRLWHEWYVSCVDVCVL